VPSTTPTLFLHSFIPLPFSSSSSFRRRPFHLTLHSFMADNRLKLFCIVDGELQSREFSVKPTLADTVDDLKRLIKIEKAPRFNYVAIVGDEKTYQHPIQRVRAPPVVKKVETTFQWVVRWVCKRDAGKVVEDLASKPDPESIQGYRPTSH
jgi:hypothetical protein